MIHFMFPIDCVADTFISNYFSFFFFVNYSSLSYNLSSVSAWIENRPRNTEIKLECWPGKGRKACPSCKTSRFFFSNKILLCLPIVVCCATNAQAIGMGG
jgi:hypothetical protein